MKRIDARSWRNPALPQKFRTDDFYLGAQREDMNPFQGRADREKLLVQGWFRGCFVVAKQSLVPSMTQGHTPLTARHPANACGSAVGSPILCPGPVRTMIVNHASDLLRLLLSDVRLLGS